MFAFTSGDIERGLDLRKPMNPPTRPQPIAGIPKVYSIGLASPQDLSESQILRLIKTHPQARLGHIAALNKMRVRNEGDE